MMMIKSLLGSRRYQRQADDAPPNADSALRKDDTTNIQVEDEIVPVDDNDHDDPTPTARHRIVVRPSSNDETKQPHAVAPMDSVVPTDDSHDDDSNEYDEYPDLQEEDDPAKLDSWTPAFRCVIFRPSLSSSPQPQQEEEPVVDVDTGNDERSVLGLDLMVWSSSDGDTGLPPDNDEEQELPPADEEDPQVWTIDGVRTTSPLYESPLQVGDIVVSVNGISNVPHGMQHLESLFRQRETTNHRNPTTTTTSTTMSNELVTLVVYNPDPEAQPNLVETWVHPSAYVPAVEEAAARHTATTVDDRNHSLSDSSSSSFLGLHLLPQPNLYLQVHHIDKDDHRRKGPSSSAQPPISFLWQHAFLGPDDVLLQVDRTSAQHWHVSGLLERMHQKVHVVAAPHRTPLMLRTQLESAALVAVARRLQQQHGLPESNRNNVWLPLVPQRAWEYLHKAERRGWCHVSCGMILASIVGGTVLVLILVALRYRRSDDLSGAADAANCEWDSSNCVLDAPP